MSAWRSGHPADETLWSFAVAGFNGDVPRSAKLLLISTAIALSVAFLYAFVVLELIG